MAERCLLPLGALLLLVASAAAQLEYGHGAEVPHVGRRLLATGPLNNTDLITSAGGFAVATNAINSALNVPSGGTITFAFHTIKLTAGLTARYNYRITCAPNFACILDCSNVTYTACLTVHGGASFSIVGITFDGMLAPRSAPLIYATGFNTGLNLGTVVVNNSVVVSPSGAIGAGLEIDDNAVVTIYGVTIFSNNVVPGGKGNDIGLVGGVTTVRGKLLYPRLTACFTYLSSMANSVAYSGARTRIQSCQYDPPKLAPQLVNGSTVGLLGQIGVSFDFSGCNLCGCSEHGMGVAKC